MCGARAAANSNDPVARVTTPPRVTPASVANDIIELPLHGLAVHIETGAEAAQFLQTLGARAAAELLTVGRAELAIPSRVDAYWPERGD